MKFLTVETLAQESKKKLHSRILNRKRLRFQTKLVSQEIRPDRIAKQQEFDFEELERKITLIALFGTFGPPNWDSRTKFNKIPKSHALQRLQALIKGFETVFGNKMFGSGNDFFWKQFVDCLKYQKFEPRTKLFHFSLGSVEKCSNETVLLEIKPVKIAKQQEFDYGELEIQQL